MTEQTRESDLRSLFDRASTMPPAERKKLVEGVRDELLRERLIALLAQNELPTANVLRHPLVASMAPLRRIDNYELLRELGSGGMGIVVLARQVEPMERLVAMKLVGDAEAGPEIAQRFKAERQALALMNHPGIARILDGGTTPEGLPYFVMEYVRGEPITGYCDRRRLGPAARLDLFVKVCDAVQHAHQKGIIHRDLKPGNVLVTEDGGPQPKIIDFGVARAVSGRLVTVAPTQIGEIVGTFLYMSPEQAYPDSQDVDTRADIYSLGVVLYELLVGQTPIELESDEGALLRFQHKLVTGVIPTPHQCALQVSDDVAARRANERRMTPAAWRRYLASDIGWVLGRALELDRNRRYAAASDLAADLLHHLRGEAVSAGPPTWRYRLMRFVHRYRISVAASALAIVALVLGTIGTTLGMISAWRAHDAAEAARKSRELALARQRAVGEFNEFVLFYSGPGLDGATPPLTLVLDRLTPMIAIRWAGPAREQERAGVRASLGRTFLALGEPSRAMQQLRLAWASADARANDDPLWSTIVLNDLSRAERQAQELDASRSHLTRMLELGVRALAPTSPAVAQRLSAIAADMPFAAERAGKLVEHCDGLLILLAGMPTSSGEPGDEPGAFDFMIGGRLLAAVGLALQSDHLPGSDDLMQRLEHLARKVLGGDVDFLTVLVNFAESRLLGGQAKAALDTAGEAVTALQRLELTGHRLWAQAERVRGLALVLSGEPAAGEAVLLALRERLAQLPAPGNQQVSAAYAALGELCGRFANGSELEAFLRTSLSGWLARAASAATAPWWPSTFEDLPAAATGAALTAVEAQAATSATSELEAVRGALLLRAGRFAAAAQSLESVRKNCTTVWPELLADLAVARHRNGDATGAASAFAELLELAKGDATMQVRCRQARQRVELAGLR
ncbi:MAG TPA: serine/threonine-protein kinase [Planctomycetota bacterium]